MCSLPSLHEINVHDSLDERAAADHFLGKGLVEAEELFRGPFQYYWDDLLWMGPRAFCFYVQAAVSFLLSSAATGASDAVNHFCGAVEFQLEYNGDGIMPARKRLHKAIQAMLNDFARYDCDAEIYGDLERRYRQLERSLAG